MIIGGLIVGGVIIGSCLSFKLIETQYEKMFEKDGYKFKKGEF